MMLKGLLRNFITTFNLLFRIHNGFLILFDRIGLLKIKRPYCLRLRNGLKFYIPDWTSAGPINSIILFNEYGNLSSKSDGQGVFIDIGAHIGAFSIYAASLNKNRIVYAYEPEKNNYFLLTKNKKLNNIKNLKTFKMAVSEKTGKDFLSISKELGSQSHSFFKNLDKKIEVETISLEDVFIKNKITKCDFLKLDCEGSEYDILLNSPKSLFEKINLVFLEYHKHPDYTPEQLEDFLKELGIYTVKRIGLAGKGHMVAYKNEKKRNSAKA